MDCSLPGSSVHGILQARILEWVAISSSRGSSWPGNQTCISWVSCKRRQIFFFLPLSHLGSWITPRRFVEWKQARREYVTIYVKKWEEKSCRFFFFLLIWALKSPFKDPWESKSRRNLWSWELTRGRAVWEGEFLLYISHEYKEV